MRFAVMLKKLREEKPITQEALAYELGVTRSTIAGYETKGKQPDYERLLQIAGYFHVSVDYLLTGSEFNTDPMQYILTESEKKILTNYSRLSPNLRKFCCDALENLVSVVGNEES